MDAGRESVFPQSGVRITARLLIAVVLALAAVIVPVTMSATSVPIASADGRMYVEQPCIIKAVTGPGLKGDGCNLYGIAKWVSTDRRPPFPSWAWKALTGCAKNAITPLVSMWWTNKGSMVILAVRCITGAVVANLTR